ncbi:MAG: carbohydrate-binding domain-containing protein [Fibrobacter sp.]|nr:carbohydrate-binding domain-containing protein [Fibrobacter sp.]
MSILKTIPFGIASVFIIACSDSSSSVSPQESALQDDDTAIEISSGATTDSSGTQQDTSKSSAEDKMQATSPTSSGSQPDSTGKKPDSSAQATNTDPSTTSSASQTTPEIHPQPGGNTDDNEEDDNVNLDGSETTLTFSGTDVTITNDNGCLEKAAGVVTVKCSGNYYLTGTASDYQVIVNTAATDTGKVDLFLNGVSLKSSDAPIYVQNAEKAELHLVKGTTNSVEDGATRSKTYTGNSGTDTTKAAIYAKDDLSIKGSGSLTVKANYNNGIHTSNDLKIKKSTGSLNVTAANCGIKGKASLTINGGTIIVNAAKGDGIKSDEDDAAALAQGKGNVKIAGGTITITAGYDGISANNTVLITKGETTDEPTIKITAGGGQTCLGNSTGGQGGRPGGGMGFGMEGNSCSPDSSMKGFKADSNIVIEAGKIEINSRDDGIHSDGDLTITGGFATVKSDDDGIHAEQTLTIKGGTVEVTMAYEGMEAAYMNFEGGVTSVVTTNDAWNAAGANASSSTGGNNGGRPGGGGGFGFGSDGSKIKVTGGFHYLYVGTGDTDGMDSNGDIDMTGGVVIIECRMNGGMGGMVDSNGETNIKGGKMLGFGTNNSEEGTQYSVTFTSENYYGTSEITFKPTFNGSKMVSNVGQPAAVSSVDGMQKQCFGSSTTNCVYYK